MIKDTWFKIYISFVVIWIVAFAYIAFHRSKESQIDTVIPAQVEQSTEQPKAIVQEKSSIVTNNITVNNPQSAPTTNYATKLAIASTFTSPPKPTQNMQLVNYTIRRGDTLAGLAKIFGTSVGTLETLNNINATTPLVPDKMILIVPKITN